LRRVGKEVLGSLASPSEVSYQHGPEMGRRDFLIALGFGAAAMAFGGCGSGLVLDDFVQRYEERIRPLKESQGIALREREFIIPSDVFDTYARAADERNRKDDEPTAEGGYILNGKSILSPKKTRFFTNELRSKGYSKEDIKFYTSLFKSNDIIILKADSYTSLVKRVQHERMHQELENLKRNDRRSYEILERARKGLRGKHYSIDEAERSGLFDESEIADARYIEGFARKKYPDCQQLLSVVGMKGNGFESFFYIMKLSENPDEFYPFLAQGVLEERAENCLEQEYPEAYRIYSELKEKCALDVKL